MVRTRSRGRRARDLSLTGVYTVVLTVVLAVPTGNPDFSLPVDESIAVALVYGFTSLGGVAVGLVVGRWWVLWSQAVMVLLSIPIVLVNVIIHDPEADGQGGAHIFVIGLVAAAALAVGVGLAHIRRHERNDPHGQLADR